MRCGPWALIYACIGVMIGTLLSFVRVEYGPPLVRYLGQMRGTWRRAGFDFRDAHLHRDDSSVADDLRERVRVLCWVMTSPKTLHTKAKHVRDTWGRRCTKTLFMSSQPDDDFPAVGLDVPEGRSHLTAKSMAAFRYIYENHRHDADWFMKTDDDTYVILENLRYFLSNKDPDEPVFYGHQFKVIVNQGYFSGGAGYVLSREALRRFQAGEARKCAKDGGAEDVQIGKCLEKLGVKAGNSTDKLGRSRFHCFDPAGHTYGHFPQWYYKFDADGGKTNFLSDYAISFHYVSPRKMYGLEFVVYHLRPYGVIQARQDLNK